MNCEKEIELLKKKVADIEDRYEIDSNKNSNQIVIDSRLLKKDIITKSYRIHKTAYELFIDTIKNNPNLKCFTVQDLLSQALLEFADKYRAT